MSVSAATDVLLLDSPSPMEMTFVGPGLTTESESSPSPDDAEISWGLTTTGSDIALPSETISPTVSGESASRSGLSARKIDVDHARPRVQGGYILHHRLTASAILIFAGLAAHFLFVFCAYGPQLFMYLQAIVLVNALACLAVLMRNPTLPLAQLRSLEKFLFLPPTAQIIFVQILQMLGAGNAENPIALLCLAQDGKLGLLFLLMAYAMFIPNTWQRALLLMAPVAMTPTIIMLYVRAVVPWAASVLTLQNIIETTATMAVALFAAIWGLITIAALRTAVQQARDLGQYRLSRKLGEGGMGQVFLAQHRLLSRPCAMKLIQPGCDADPLALIRFEHEVRSMSRLSHWNNVEIYDFGHTEDGTFYYVMEYLPGMNLAELVARFGGLPPARVIHLLRQICRALHEAHSFGLIHRDLKPANIFATKRGGEYDVAKLLDFGLVADATNAETVMPRNHRRTVAGSPHFMSPEQGFPQTIPDVRSDIYSLGACAYFLLSGVPPFEGRTPIQVMMAHQNTPPKPINERCSHIPCDLAAITMRCLEKDPADRFESVLDLEKALGQCISAREWSSRIAEDWWRIYAPEIDYPIEIA